MSGYGLVVGLDGSGDQTTQMPYTTQSVANYLQQLGITLPDIKASQLQLKNVAAVIVTELTVTVACSCVDEPLADDPWRLGMISGRTSCHFGLNAQLNRRGHHDGGLCGRDAVESLTVFEKAAERNDFGRRVHRH